jgi:adenine-specific DNA-methyltransferase
MPTTEKLRNKLMTKLTELFQLDQPDLDFGFYRIMQTKAEQVKSFIEKDLLQIIEDAFGEQEEQSASSLKKNAKAKLIETLGDSALDDCGELVQAFKETPAGKAYLNEIERIDSLNDNISAESDVYDHLYRFFERYYDEGDFISRRYYARENAGKAAPFAIPYNGEEVKLHWANADQYYIKTTEYFSNYSFDITQAAEIRKMSDVEKVLNGIPEKTLKVHFRIIDASEGEHGNVKAAEDKKRFFILHEENPVEFNDADELVVNFEYKALPGGKNDVDADTEKALKEKFGKSLNKGDMPNLAIAEKILKALETTEHTENTETGNKNSVSSVYSVVMNIPAPTDKISNRPLLAKYINQYTARNTCDYFIHKDLGGFLKRELDFYIKNEVMHLDDIENADAPAVENYLAKLKVIRKIATKLIDFLAQLEDFQKKLWLKKKFVTETNYCITLDRVPEELYGEIAANDAQIQEWIKLGFIEENIFQPQNTRNTQKKDDELDFGEADPSVFSVSSVVKENKYLVLDTAFFSPDFKAKLIASIEDFDEQCDGLLIHSENFQALNLLQERYREQVKCVYIDPPYNTGGDGFAYKDAYQHSSWLSFLFDRVSLAKEIISKNGLFFSSIDFVEESNLRLICDSIFLDENFLSKIIWEKRFTRSNNAKLFSTLTENILAYRKSFSVDLLKEPRNEKADSTYSNPDNDPRGVWTSVSYVNPATKEARPNLSYNLKNPITGSEVIHPTNAWKYEKATYERHVAENRLYWGQEGGHTYPRLKKFLSEMDGMVPVDLWKHEETGTTDSASKLLENEFGQKVFEFPKPPSLMKRVIGLANFGFKDGCILDFYAGTAPTGHAVINLNREDNGNRKYILVEMGDYFDTVTKPRITKVIYSSDWKNGKPVPSKNNSVSSVSSVVNKYNGISHCFKYIRLESYEDTLNNLVFDDNPVRSKAIESNPSLKEDYMLRYLLNVETRGSQSLLNIDAFADPCAYKLKVKKPGSDEQVTQHIDLIETFNYLLGLRLENMAAPQTFTASFTRKPDPELPEDQHTKLVVDGKIRLVTTENTEYTEEEKNNNSVSSVCSVVQKSWWFRKVEGWVPADSMNPNNGQKERVLIVWRKLTGNLEEDNLMLDEWFTKYRISTRDFEYDIIYVNGSNNLPNLKKDDENWKVRLIEEEFHKRMWEVGE